MFPLFQQNVHNFTSNCLKTPRSFFMGKGREAEASKIYERVLFRVELVATSLQMLLPEIAQSL